MDRPTRPPIMAHVSVNQSEIVTVSCGYTITTHRVQVRGGKRILCEKVSEAPRREIRNSTYVLELCSLDFTVQIGPFEHLVSSHTCEDKYEFPQSLLYPSKWCTLKLHRLIQIGPKRRYLGTVMLKHESSEEGASRCAISVADWNSELSECQKLVRETLTNDYVTRGERHEKVRRGEYTNTYLRSKGGDEGKVIPRGGRGHKS